MQITSEQLKIKTKRGDSYELSRFFVLYVVLPTATIRNSTN